MEDRYDFLIVGSGIQSSQSSTLIARLTGKTKILTLTSTGSEMWLQIATDRTGTDLGFSVNLTQVSNVEGIGIVIVNLKRCYDPILYAIHYFRVYSKDSLK